jgi:hypothetical protein
MEISFPISNQLFSILFVRLLHINLTHYDAIRQTISVYLFHTTSNRWR